VKSIIISGNPNHPKKGDRLAVDPIRKAKDIKAISKLTQDSPRDHLLFIMGINNGLRACDLIKLKVKDVNDMKIGDTLTIKESKTGKDNILLINKTVFKALKNYLDKVQPDDEKYLFPSRKGNSHLQTQAVSKMVKKWTTKPS
jgi:integrase